jgi:ATP-dependent helicase/nuclease subunit A
MRLTGAQRQAIAAQGNVLVIAGAGTGKTTTLVERCLDCLLRAKPHISLDQILMVTFTEAAAAEMRQRIRDRLIQESEKTPGDTRWVEQLALFETAHIGTIHSFCFRLIRQHFYELHLDPQMTVLPEEEARLQADEVLELLLQKHYAGTDAAAKAVQQLIQLQGRGWDEPTRNLVLRLHHYTQALPNPSGWIRDQLAVFVQPEPGLWKQWRLQAVADWCGDRLPVLDGAAPTNPIAARCVPLLRQLQSAATDRQRAQVLKSFEAAQECPVGKKGTWGAPLEEFFADAAFLASIHGGEGEEPLAEDWTWVRSQMRTVLELTREFTDAFTEAKRELGVLDFHDLEQYALRLLWDTQTNQPTPIAAEWREKLRFIFVDEYQDINAAQDKILQALSREGTAANRFLVGDIKQSIYRFRLADPYIFRGYLRSWGQGEGTAIPLVENFRSREALLNFVNDLFAQIMRSEVGGVGYGEESRLRFGTPAERVALSAAASADPCVQLHLRKTKSREGTRGEDDDSELAELEESAKEARLIGLRLWELKQKQQPVWDEETNSFRPMEWSDIALLLRAPANKVESYAKEFARLKIPLEVARRGFYRSTEISDLVSLLQILDNPLQDIPLLAVLHSPVVGLTVSDLALIRLALPKGRYWNAVIRWQENDREKARRVQPPADSIDYSGQKEQLLSLKLTSFLSRYNRWRRLVRQVSLSRCLEIMLKETHYTEWLLTQPRGEQRHLNVRRLVGLAERFDQFQRQGLFRFLRFIANQQATETEPEVRSVSVQNAVRLMSLHQSKGLEFPVVVLADLGKPFNRSDLSADILLDEQHGLCPQIKPPHTGQRYPSLPYWLARRRQGQELLGEELRLLYVGMTRARDLLLLTASISESRWRKLWNFKRKFDPELLKSARSYADWLGFWFAQNCPNEFESIQQGRAGWLDWAMHDEKSLLREPRAAITAPESNNLKIDQDAQLGQRLLQQFSWRYPWEASSRQPAKTSVSALRRAALEDEEADRRSWPELYAKRFGAPSAAKHSRRKQSKLSAAEIGDAHHAFLQLVDLERTCSLVSLKQEASRLEAEGALTTEETACLDFRGLAAFWCSDVGRKIRGHAEVVHRELAFTARFSPNELAALTSATADPQLEQEYVVVQGVADLVVILPREIWLVDFKTDMLEPADLKGRVRFYAPQLLIYSAALSRTFRRPVSQTWLYFLTLQQAVPLGTSS